MLKYLEIRCTYKNVLYNGNCINIAQKIRCTEMFYNTEDLIVHSWYMDISCLYDD